jgi:hypothetical protein
LGAVEFMNGRIAQLWREIGAFAAAAAMTLAAPCDVVR